MAYSVLCGYRLARCPSGRGCTHFLWLLEQRPTQWASYTAELIVLVLMATSLKSRDGHWAWLLVRASGSHPRGSSAVDDAPPGPSGHSSSLCVGLSLCPNFPLYKDTSYTGLGSPQRSSPSYWARVNVPRVRLIWALEGSGGPSLLVWI